ncbi:UDP-glucuronosyltransferase 1-1 [Homalodisca vitripennis]|nr:UDP-glucuronosyltransferase 1-1 [Homalodisca vitripennis]
MARLSHLYRDQPNSPADRLVFWVEYLLRHGGAHHLRPASALLPWYQLYLIDILALLLATASRTLFLRSLRYLSDQSATSGLVELPPYGTSCDHVTWISESGFFQQFRGSLRYLLISQLQVGQWSFHPTARAAIM